MANLLVTCLLLCCPIMGFSYPQEYSEDTDNNGEQDLNEPIKFLHAENSNAVGGKILRAIKVAPHYNVIPDGDNNNVQHSSFRTSTHIPIIRYDKHQALDGSYKHSYETGNNIIAEETGFFKNPGVKDLESLVQHGSYKYTAPDGTVISASYTADEEGFKVEGSHLPTAPPIPEEIQKGLAKIYEGIRLRQEAEARELKEGKIKHEPLLQEPLENSVTDNYPARYNHRQKVASSEE